MSVRPVSTDLKLTATLLEAASRVIRKKPLLSAEIRRGQDPAQYLPLTNTADGWARVEEAPVRAVAEDHTRGHGGAEPDLMPYPDGASAALQVRTWGQAGEAAAETRRERLCGSPRYAERRQRTLDALLDAIEQRAQQLAGGRGQVVQLAGGHATDATAVATGGPGTSGKFSSAGAVSADAVFTAVFISTAKWASGMQLPRPVPDSYLLVVQAHPACW